MVSLEGQKITRRFFEAIETLIALKGDTWAKDYFDSIGR